MIVMAVSMMLVVLLLLDGTGHCAARTYVACPGCLAPALLYCVCLCFWLWILFSSALGLSSRAVHSTSYVLPTNKHNHLILSPAK